MKQVTGAYRHVSATPEFHEIERLRSKARHDEAQALKNAEQRGKQLADKKWEGILAATIADKDAAIAEKDAIIAQLCAVLSRGKLKTTGVS